MSYLSDFKSANIDLKTFYELMIAKIGGDGKIIDCESSSTELAKILDTQSGIDVFYITKKGVRGIAIRVQWGKNWKTFTIRYERANGMETEYKKRNNAIRKGFLYPHMTLQVYLDKRDNAGIMLGGAIVKTSDLYRAINNNWSMIDGDSNDDIGIRTCPEGNKFVYIKFDFLKKNNANIIIFK